MSAKLFGLALRLFSKLLLRAGSLDQRLPQRKCSESLGCPGGFEQHLLVKWDLQKEISGPSSPWHPGGEVGAFPELSELPQLCPAAAEPFTTRSTMSLRDPSSG